MKGKNNVVDDSLSRRPSISLMDVAENWKATLEVEYAKDKISCELSDGTNNNDRYKVLEGIIYYKGKIYLVPNSILEEILKNSWFSSSKTPRFLQNIPNVEGNIFMERVQGWCSEVC